MLDPDEVTERRACRVLGQATLAWRWVVHPAEADAPELRIDARLRHGSDGGWSVVPNDDDRGRVHTGVSGD